MQILCSVLFFEHRLLGDSDEVMDQKTCIQTNVAYSFGIQTLSPKNLPQIPNYLIKERALDGNPADTAVLFFSGRTEVN